MDRRTLLAWSVTRGLLLVVVVVAGQRSGLGDLRIYHLWAHDTWCRGEVPGRDYPWEYPIGALLFVALPVGCASAATYALCFLAFALALDLGILLLLRTTAHESTAGAIWLVCVPLLGPVVLQRFDIGVCLCVIAGLVLIESRPRLAGGLLALAAAVKLWPILLIAVAAAPRATRRAVLTGAGAVAGAVTAVLLAAGFWVHAGYPLSYQVERGTEVESLPSLPWVWHHALGGPGFVFANGGWEVRGSGTQYLVAAAEVVVALTLLLLLWRAFTSPRPPTLEVGAAVVALLLATDKVLSPQYLLWLVAAVAASATRSAPSGVVVRLLAVACLLTQVIYPLWFQELVDGDLALTALLTLRDAALAWVAVLMTRSALRACVRRVPEPTIVSSGP